MLSTASPLPGDVNVTTVYNVTDVTGRGGWGGYPALPAGLYYYQISLLAVAMAAGVPGNAVVVAAYSALKHRSSCDWYLLYMAVLDLLICLVRVPTHLAMETGHWRQHGTNALCKTVYWLSQSVVTASVILFALIAIDRYLKVCQRSVHISARFSRNCILGITALSGLAALPALWMYGNNRHGSCVTITSSLGLSFMRVYYTALFTIFVVMFVIVVVCYTSIIVTVKRAQAALRSHRIPFSTTASTSNAAANTPVASAATISNPDVVATRRGKAKRPGRNQVDVEGGWRKGVNEGGVKENAECRGADYDPRQRQKAEGRVMSVTDCMPGLAEGGGRKGWGRRGHFDVTRVKMTPRPATVERDVGAHALDEIMLRPGRDVKRKDCVVEGPLVGDGLKEGRRDEAGRLPLTPTDTQHAAGLQHSSAEGMAIPKITGKLHHGNSLCFTHAERNGTACERLWAAGQSKNTETHTNTETTEEVTDTETGRVTDTNTNLKITEMEEEIKNTETGKARDKETEKTKDTETDKVRDTESHEEIKDAWTNREAKYAETDTGVDRVTDKKFQRKGTNRKVKGEDTENVKDMHEDKEVARCPALYGPCTADSSLTPGVGAVNVEYLPAIPDDLHLSFPKPSDLHPAVKDLDPVRDDLDPEWDDPNHLYDLDRNAAEGQHPDVSKTRHMRGSKNRFQRSPPVAFTLPSDVSGPVRSNDAGGRSAADNQMPGQAATHHSSRSLRLTLLLLVVTGVFVVSWVPPFLAMAWFFYVGYTPPLTSADLALQRYAPTTYLLNHFVTPVLYLTLSSSFRQNVSALRKCVLNVFRFR